VLDPITDYVSNSLLMLTLFALSIRAAFREPGHGFGPTAATFLLQPLVAVAVYYWELNPVRVRLVTWIPFCVAGMTLLAAAQFRARERMVSELKALRAGQLKKKGLETSRPLAPHRTS
jgi:hypothetical protein